MKPYPAYKPTGLAWLPQIPEGWEVKRLKTVATKIYKGKGITKDEVVSGGNCSCVRYGEIYTKYQVSFRQCFSKTNLNEVGVPAYFYKGDLLFAGTGERIDEIGKCIAYLGDEKCMAGGDIIITKHNENPLFMSFAVNSPYVQYQKSQGKIKLKVVHISASEIGNLVVALPPLAEQERIAAYLDGVCAKVGKLVSAKKRQIELLKEAIVSLAEEAIRDDAVPWKRMRQIVHLAGAAVVREDEKEYIPIGVYNRGRGIFHKAATKGKDLGDSDFFSLEPGDLLFSGQFSWEGAVAMIEESERGCIASHRYPMVRANDETVLLEYLWAFFQTKYGDLILNQHSRGAAGRNRPLNIRRLLGEEIPIPNMALQLKIAKLVRALNKLRITEPRYVNKLEEYKSSVISSVVTGQIDIRDVKMEDA